MTWVIQNMVFLDFLINKFYGWHIIPMLCITILMTTNPEEQIILSVITIISSLTGSLNNSIYHCSTKNIMIYYITSTYLILQTFQSILVLLVLYTYAIIWYIKFMMYFLLTQFIAVYLYYIVSLLINISCDSCFEYHDYINKFNKYKISHLS